MLKQKDLAVYQNIYGIFNCTTIVKFGILEWFSIQANGTKSENQPSIQKEVISQQHRNNGSSSICKELSRKKYRQLKYEQVQRHC